MPFIGTQSDTYFTLRVPGNDGSQYIYQMQIGGSEKGTALLLQHSEMEPFYPYSVFPSAW